jgi:hypothetical protein
MCKPSIFDDLINFNTTGKIFIFVSMYCTIKKSDAQFSIPYADQKLLQINLSAFYEGKIY